MAFTFGTGTSGGLFRPQTSTPATGGLTFGAPQTSTAPAFGFGAPQTTSAAPAFGFGTSQASAAPTFGFSTQTNTTAPTSFGFGAPQTSAAAPNFGFGTAQSSTAAPSFGFGAPQASSAAPTFGFGTSQTQTAAPSFGFGAPQTSAAPAFGFGAPATSTAGNLFGGTGAFGGFGTSAAPPGGVSTAQASFGMFGSGLGQQPQQAVQQQQQQSGVDAVIYSTVYCNVYGDERDAVLSRWNVLQAAWGTGKGFYSSNAGPVEYTASNSLCRFKSIGYTKLPEAKNEDGIVSLIFNKSDTDVRQNQAQLIQTISAAFGSKPNLSVVVEGVSGLDANKTEVLISMQERSATGAVHKAPASDLSSFLWQQQPTVRAQLNSLGVVNCVPKMRPTSEQLREYLATPPAGIDARLWKQAQAENPDPEHFVPVPLIGFGDLVRHLHQQEKETRWHQGTLDKLAEELSNLQSRAAEASVALNEQRRRHIDLQHRVLKVLIKQECSRKEGFSLQPEEERLRVQLESIHNELSIPTQFRGRLNELLSQIRMRQSAFTPAEKMSERYNMDPAVLDELKLVLKTQQEGMAQLMNILKADMSDFHLLENALQSH